MNTHWYSRVNYADPRITRTDFRITRRCRRQLKDTRGVAHALADYFKTQRLLPQEIEQWNKSLSSNSPLEETLAQKIRWALAEGVLRDDLLTVDEDAFIGTCGQLLFKWVRSQYYAGEILYSSPKLLTDSSKKQGIDCFEILGDSTDISSLNFIVWEVKATDDDVASRTNEIYAMHKNRTPRLLRGLQLQLCLEYPEDKYPVIGTFVQQILDHWQNNTVCKRLGGAVIFDTTANPRAVFTTFHTQFPELHSSICRQVILIEVPKFRRTRRNLWKYLQSQIY